MPDPPLLRALKKLHEFVVPTDQGTMPEREAHREAGPSDWTVEGVDTTDVVSRARSRRLLTQLLIPIGIAAPESSVLSSRLRLQVFKQTPDSHL
jgi:hypothetical protein